MSATATLKAVLLGEDRSMSRTFDQAGGKAEGLGGKLGKVGPMAAAAGAAFVAGGVVAGKALYDIGSQFDDMSDTIRVGTGATGDALDDLNDSAKNIGKSVPAEFSDIGTAVADLNTRLGLTGEPLEDMSTQFLNLSRITGTDLQKNIADVTRVFGDWGIASEDQADSLDAIFRASQATGTGVDSLSTNVVKFGAPMRQLGFSFEETLGLLGKFEKEGVNTEVVMGSMRIALGKMARAGEEPVETLARVTDEIKNAGDAGDANAIALELFGAKAGPDMAAAIREGRFELGDLLGVIESGSETINAASEETMDWSEQWQMFKNNAMIALEPVAKGVFDLMGRFGTWLNEKGSPALERFSNWFSGELWPALKDGYNQIMPALKDAWDTITDAVGKGDGSWKDFGKTLTEKVIPFLSKLITVWLPMLATQWAIIINTIQTVWGAFEKLVAVARGAIGGIIEEIGFLLRDWAGMLRALSKVPGFGWAADAADALDRAADKALNLGRNIRGIPKSWGVTVGVRTVYTSVGTPSAVSASRLGGLTRATGGPVMGGRSYLVGENGPELFTPDRSGSITDARNTAKAIGGGSKSGSSGGGSDKPIVVQLMLDGRMVQEVLVDRKRALGGMPLGLA